MAERIGTTPEDITSNMPDSIVDRMEPERANDKRTGCIQAIKT